MEEKPIRILNLFTIMNRGGAEAMVMNYYRNIDRSKVQFDFLVHRQEKGVYEEEIEKLGGKIYRMPPIYPQNFYKYKRKIREFLKAHPEYKIIHSHMSELGYFVFKEAKRQGVPTIICHAHSAPREFNSKMIVRDYFKIRMRPYITYMFTCGEKAGLWLYGKKNKNSFVQINNAIDAEKFIYDEFKSKNIRSNFGITDELVIGHVGRFIQAKNHEKLIDIFYEICKINPRSKLILVGEGVLQEHIIHKVKDYNLQDKVLFLGGRSDVNDILQAVDIYLFPSFHEGLSVSMVEAQASGLQCFISDTIPEECIITNNVLQFDLSQSSRKIAEFILSKHKSYERKNTYKEIVSSGFDIKENALNLQNFYLKCYEKNV